MSKSMVKVEVFAFDEAYGHRKGTSAAGKPYSFYTQQGVLDGGPGQPPVVFKLQHDNRSDVLAPGWYSAELSFFSDRYQSLQVRLINIRAEGVVKPQVVNG